MITLNNLNTAELIQALNIALEANKRLAKSYSNKFGLDTVLQQDMQRRVNNLQAAIAELQGSPSSSTPPKK